MHDENGGVEQSVTEVKWNNMTSPPNPLLTGVPECFRGQDSK